MSGSPFSRRRLLLTAAALTTVTLTACDLDRTRANPAAAPSPDPDQAIVTAARAELTTLIQRLGAGSAHAALVATHRVQLAALQGDQPPLATRRRPLTSAQTVASERRAAARFTRWASTAVSGDLARVLASIAAGIRMQPVLRAAA